jgi:hypothetical protein
MFGETFINTEAIFDKACAANLTHKHTRLPRAHVPACVRTPAGNLLFMM